MGFPLLESALWPRPQWHPSVRQEFRPECEDVRRDPVHRLAISNVDGCYGSNGSVVSAKPKITLRALNRPAHLRRSQHRIVRLALRNL